MMRPIYPIAHLLSPAKQWGSTVTAGVTLSFGVMLMGLAGCVSQSPSVKNSPQSALPINTQVPSAIPDAITPVQAAVRFGLSGSLVVIKSHWLDNPATTKTAKQSSGLISEIINYPLDGSPPVLLAQLQGSIRSLSASRDGKQLIYTRQDTLYPLLYRFDLTTQQETSLSPKPANYLSGSFSDDGRYVLMAVNLSDNFEIYQLDTQKPTDNLLQMTHNPAIDFSPAWSPDGKGFLFSSDREGGVPQIYSYRWHDSDQRLLSWLTGDYRSNPRYSSDGRYVAYLSGTKTTAAPYAKVYDINTGKTLPLSTLSLDTTPSFSPDGQWLIYARAGQIYLVANPFSHSAKPSQSPVSEPILLDLSKPPTATAYQPISHAGQVRFYEPVWLPQSISSQSLDPSSLKPQPLNSKAAQ